MWNLLMETWGITKKLGLFYVIFLTVPLYIQWYQFVIVQVTLPILFNRVISNFILFIKSLHLNILNIMILYTLKVVLVYHPTRLEKQSTIFKSTFSKSTLKETNILWFQLYMASHMESLTVYLSVLTRLILITIKVIMKGLTENTPDLYEPALFFFWTR